MHSTLVQLRIHLSLHVASAFRRYGSLEQGRFCFEGGSRCGKGEGLHVLRLDDPQELQNVFDLASKGKLENKRKSLYRGSK